MQGVMRTFVGRRSELAELEAGLEDARSARGRLFLLSGEAGIGKTRLCDELALRASDNGFVVRWGRCWEVGGAPAYWPWIQVLRAVLRDRGEVALPAYARDSLARLLPELGAAAPSSAQADSAQERFALFDAVTSTLRDTARTAPLLVVLDDLHAADPSSLALLLFVARELRDLRVCLIGTYREREMRENAEARDALARIAREAQTLPVARFTPDEVRALLHSRAGGVDDGTLDTVFRTTEGLPLFVAEVARARPADGDWVVPETVRAALSARVDALPESVREVLEAAAVLGRETSRSLLAGLLGREEAELRAPLSAALAAGVTTEPEPGWVGFSHALIRDAIYRGLTDARRCELHERAADTLEHAHAPEAGLAEIANHLLAALPRAGAERALRGSLRAAQRALGTFAFEDAAAILDHAFTSLGTREVAAPLRCEALLVLGEARVRAHRDGREACQEAAEIARSLSDPTLLARAGLALGAEIWAGRVNPVLIALLEESLLALPDTPSALRARVLARLAGALQPALDPLHPVGLAREAIAMARGLGDDRCLRIVLYAAGSALVDYAPLEERLDVDQQTFVLAEAARDWPVAFRGRMRMYFDHLQQGAWQPADAALSDCEAIAEKLRQPNVRWYAALMRALQSDLRGDFAGGDAHRATARELMRRAGDDGQQALLITHTFASALLRHEHTGLTERAPLAIAAAMPPDVGTSLHAWLLAICASREGRRERAEHELRLALASYSFKYELFGMHVTADICLACNLREVAAMVLPYLEPYAGQITSWGVFGFGVFGPVSGYLAGLLGVLERYDEAFPKFVHATEHCRSLGARPALARCLYDHAQARTRRGRPEDLELARTLLDESRMLAAQMEMRGLTAWIDALEGELANAAQAIQVAESAHAAATVATSNTAVPTRALAALRATAFTLAREADVWVVTHGGRTFRLKHSRGLAMLAMLVEQPGRELHALALGESGDPGELGDAGAVTDREAARAYRERIEALREREKTAELLGDADAAEHARSEIEQIAAHLSAALGMGGKDRKAASAAERARVNVRRRIKDAIERIAREDAELGRYLSLSIRTGTFSVFDPIR